MNQLARTCALKDLCEEKLYNMTSESERLKGELEKLTSKNSEGAKANDRLHDCETEIDELKKRIKHLKGIEDEDVQTRLGKNIIMVEAKIFARMREEQFAAVLREKEEEHKRILKEEKDELVQRKLQVEMESKLHLEHEVALQEKELKTMLK